MMFKMSATPCSPAPLPTPSGSSSEDSIRSFKLFLDLITPAEFSKLLRARVSHLLKTWPPLSESTSSSGSNVHHGSSDPSFKSIQAFATFFRTQDTSGSSSGDVSATSLAAIQHQLLALQTLLSFLSGRELKDIVRARLGEGGKERVAAVQGLMDIMRNAGGDGEEQKEEEAMISVEAEEHIESEDESEQGKVNDPGTAGGTMLGSASGSNLHRQNSSLKHHAEMDAREQEELQPPKKRQRLATSQYNQATASSSYTSAPQSRSPTTLQSEERRNLSHSRANPSLPSLHPPSNLSTSVSASLDYSGRTIASRNATVTGNKSVSPVSLRHSSELESHPNLDPGRDEELTVVQLTDVDMEISDPGSGASKENIEDSDEEDEVGGLVVTLIGEDEGAQMLRSPRLGSPEQRGPEIAAFVPTSDCPTPSATILSVTNEVAQDRSRLVEPRPHTEAISHTQMEQKQQVRSLGTTTEEAGLQASQQEQPSHNNLSSLSRGPPFDVTSVHASPSPSPSPSLELLRSPSQLPSYPGSEVDDRASPPGPLLHAAVDWASTVIPSPINLDIRGEEGSDDTLALGTSAAYDPESSAFGFTKPLYARWEEEDGDRERASDAGINAEKMSQSRSVTGGDEGETEQPRKLYIRLPARPKAKVTPGAPLSETNVKEDAQSLEPLNPLNFSEQDRKEGKLSPSAEVATGISSPVTTPATANAPSPQPQSSASASGTQSVSPSMVPYNSNFPLPPDNPHRQAAATAAFVRPAPVPYSWFSAMFYVPVRHPIQARKMPGIPWFRESESASGSAHATSANPSPSTSEAQKQTPKRKGSIEPASEAPAPPPLAPELEDEEDPNILYIDDVGVKESASVKRRCFNCRAVQAPSWRKSKLNVGKILCNKCGIYETTHMSPRPLKTRPRRSQVAEGGASSPQKRKKSPKKVVL